MPHTAGNVRQIVEAPSYLPQQETGGVDGSAALDLTPVRIEADGELYDMARYRRVQEARTEVDAAHAAMTDTELPPAES